MLRGGQWKVHAWSLFVGTLESVLNNCRDMFNNLQNFIPTKATLLFECIKPGSVLTKIFVIG